MSGKNVFRNAGAATVILLSLLSAPATQAQVRGDAALGAAIAAQGNQALQLIRAEVRQALRVLQPRLEAPRVAPPAKQAGAAGPAATARAAE